MTVSLVFPHEARLLCQDLGYLPLGLELVSRFLKRRQNWSIKKYRDKLKDKGLKVRGIQESTEDMTAQRGVKAAFEISWQELEQEAQEIAYYLSLFEVAPIPYELIKEICPIEDEDDLEDILEDSLINSNLIKDLGNQVYEIHTLINQYLREKLEESNLTNEVKKTYCKLMVSVAKEIPEQPIKTNIERLTLKIPHLTVAAKELNKWMKDEDLGWPYLGISRFYGGQGFYKEAEPWYKQCLNILQERLGEEHPYVAQSLNNLAVLYNEQGRYSEAESLNLQALKLRKNLLGEDHPDVAQSLNNLALLYSYQGRYSEAESLNLQALKLNINLLGENHPDVALSINNLALLYSYQGRYSEAKALFLQALELWKNLLGENHPDVALSINNLARIYYYQRRYEEAEPLFLQALELRKNLLGEDHPDVAQSIHDLAVLYKAQGRYSEAESLNLQALELRKNLLGEDHPYVALSINNLAELYKAQGRYEEAEPLYLQALELYKKRLGEDHPKTKTVKENYELMKKEME
ncbi:MAG: tetratricopeptide repeat protein [Crocosphaera sp.]